jgi:hypothetical protein
MDNRRARPLAHRGVAIRVQNNFYPILSTKLYEQSGNTVHNFMLGNLQLCGNLIVGQTDRDKAYQLLVSIGQLPYLLISVHIASCATSFDGGQDERQFMARGHRATRGSPSRFALRISRESP